MTLHPSNKMKWAAACGASVVIMCVQAMRLIYSVNALTQMIYISCAVGSVNLCCWGYYLKCFIHLFFPFVPLRVNTPLTSREDVFIVVHWFLGLVFCRITQKLANRSPPKCILVTFLNIAKCWFARDWFMDLDEIHIRVYILLREWYLWVYEHDRNERECRTLKMVCAVPV